MQEHATLQGARGSTLLPFGGHDEIFCLDFPYNRDRTGWVVRWMKMHQTARAATTRTK